MGGPNPALCGMACVCSALVGLIFVFAVYDVCQLDEYCIVFDRYTQTLDSELKTGGRYAIGLGREFKHFSRRHQVYIMSTKYQNEINYNQLSNERGNNTIINTWDVNVRANDGLKMECGIALQYVYGSQHDDLVALGEEFKYMYDNFGPEFTNVLEMITLASIKDSAQNYNAFDFF